ncbi:MAG TPA: PIG-L family deacetylase [Bryobacteraceae bacterium]|nr:PIG-L family deacetylase [Bryobacteraceae bacterium]
MINAILKRVLSLRLCAFLFLTPLMHAAADRPFRGRVLVVVTCHADDFSIFAGGTIAKLIDQGYTGYLVRITDDEKSGGPDPQHNAAQNDREVREVARILGLSAVYSLNFKNDELGRVPHDRLRDAVMYYLRKLKANTIYTFDPYATYGEENPDHLAAGRAVEDAARNAGNPRYSPEQIRSGIMPQTVSDAYYWARAPIAVNTVTDTTAYLDRKIEALTHHHAQFPPSTVSYFRKYDENIGRMYNLQAAEVSHHIWYRNSGANTEKTSLFPRAEIETRKPASSPGLKSFRDKVVVVISPHGMDYVQAVGGTVAKAARDGASVYLVRVTDDERHGGNVSRVQARTEMAEATRQAAKILGLRQVIDLDLKDGELAEVSEPELRARFSVIFRALAPDAIFTVDPWAPYDRDLDDARIGHAAEDAAWTASHLSFYPELVLTPKTNFKVITNRYFWTLNGGEQVPNYHEDIATTADAKSNALQAFQSAVRHPQSKSSATSESFYYYHAANPLDWFEDWLANSPSLPPLPKPSSLELGTGTSKRVLIITPELTDWLVNAGATVQQMIRDGYKVSLVCVGDGSKSIISPVQLRHAFDSLGISTMINFGFREGELSAVPGLILRDRLTEVLRLLTPDTILLPDPWQPYTTNEAMVIGDVGSDAIYEWALKGAAGRILYWEQNGGQGTAEFTGNMARTNSLLRQLHLSPASSLPAERFHISWFGKQ